MNAAEFLRKHGIDRFRFPSTVPLVKFGDNPSNGNWLMLVRHHDGRLDIVDSNCSDTGSDLRDLTAQELMDNATEWVDCVTGGEVLGEDEDTEDLTEQLDALAGLLGVERSIVAWESC